MTSKEKVLHRERQRGRAAALNLASRTINDGLDGTAIIAEQEHVPAWREDAVYTLEHVGFPVQDGDQVYTILQPHTPAHNPGFRPADLPAIYSIKHTTDPKMAKDYMTPNGTSGMYMTGDCCRVGEKVFRSVVDNNVWHPNDYPAGWEEV
jgi:hypothetical protein